MHRCLPSPAMLVALLALFVALGAGAYAATKLPKNSVKSKQIKDRQVKNKDLAEDSVDTANIRADAVRGAQIAPGSVGSAQIGDGSVSFGDLETAAQPDKDLDLLKSGPITVDDPVDGNTTTTAILSYGPFTIYGNCRDVTSTAQISYTMVSTEHGWVTASTSSPDDFNPGEVKAISGTLASGTDYTIAGGGYALTDSGRFLSFGVIGVNKTGGQTDCLYHASGWGG